MAIFDACGLSKKAEEYDYDSSNSPDTYFFSAAIKCDFWKTTTWIIHMLNYSIERLYTKEKGPSVELAIPDTKEHKKFYSGEVLWNMAVVGGTMPTVLSDMLYIFSQESLNKARELNGDARKDFCYKLRGKILSESNNIAPISIIALIGIEFEYAYPDYALVLLFSEELISDDLRRFAYCQGSLSIHLLEDEMANAVGLPGFKKRYTPILDSSHGSLRECLAALKAFGMEKEGKEAFESIKNQFSEEESIKAFGIPLDTLDPSLSYIAQGNGGLYIVPKNMQKHPIDDGDINGTKLFRELDSLLDLKKQRQLTANDCMPLIKKSISNINSQNSAIYTKTIIIVSAEALMKDDLSLDDRNYLVSFFLDKVEEKRNGGVFVFDPEMSLAFFAQIDKGISKKYRDRLLLLLFYSAFSFGDNSLSGLAKYAKAYICKDTGLTRKVFSCLLSLSLLSKETYSPLDQFPQNAITFRNDSEKNDYSARKEKINNAKDKIFRDQLIGDGQVDFNSFRVDEADLNYLAVSLPYSRIVFDDSHFLGFLSSVLTAMFAKMSEYSNDERINFWSLDEASSFIDREIVKSDDAKPIIDALSGALPSTFNSQIEEFLKDCFSGLPLEFMDSYENVSRREKAKEKSCLLKETSVKFPLYQDIFEKGVLFSIFTFRNPNALAKCPTSFSYSDKRFLSDNIISLGRNHISDVLLFIHVFHVKELMPDLLQSVVTILKSPEGQEFMKSVKDNDRHILREIMLVSFSDYQDAIKKNVNYTKAFSLYCQLLMLAGIEESYIVFDDFLAH
jgi:hypothetical protein